ncbi:MAG: GTPase Era [Candidatus Omnitrophica bacterium]|nr:GTPase Era [Candidatus Omnitrophota bacterium]
MTISGFVAITGQPNVGKSTLLNGFLGEKLAIVTEKPETTRDNIKGIYTDEDAQIIFTDTPGIHRPHDLLGKVMLTRAESSILECDIVLFVTEAGIAFNSDDMRIVEKLPDAGTGKKVLMVINKVDKVRDKKLLLPLIDKATGIYPFAEIVPMCALKDKDLGHLVKTIKKYLPEGPFLYPEDELTDKDNRFCIQEIIREKTLLFTYEEIPHSVAVVVDEIVPSEGKKPVKVFATIFVERASQKSILVGKEGAMIKKIGQTARKEIGSLISSRVHLDLWVKVKEKWKKDPNSLRELGYS